MPFLFQCKKDSRFASFFLTTACFDDINSLRRSVILPGGLFMPSENLTESSKSPASISNIRLPNIFIA